MNRYLAIFLILLLWGCNKHAKRDALENIKWGNHYVAEKVIEKKLRQLTDSNKYDQAFKLLNTLISLNRQNGYLYFERGFVELYKINVEAANKDFKIADSLNYDKKECQLMIQVSKEAIDKEKTIGEKIK